MIWLHNDYKMFHQYATFWTVLKVLEEMNFYDLRDNVTNGNKQELISVCSCVCMCVQTCARVCVLVISPRNTNVEQELLLKRY